MDNALDEHFNLLMNTDMNDAVDELNVTDKGTLMSNPKDKSSFSFKNIVYWISVICLVLIICVIIYYIMVKLFLITPAENKKDGSSEVDKKQKHKKKKPLKKVSLANKIKKNIDSEKNTDSVLSDLSDLSDISDLSDMSSISAASTKLNEFLKLNIVKNKEVKDYSGAKDNDSEPMVQNQRSLMAHFFTNNKFDEDERDAQIEELKSKSSKKSKNSLKKMDIENKEEGNHKKSSKRGRPKKVQKAMDEIVSEDVM